MRISNYVCGPLMSNCYILQDEGTGKALIIDAGECMDELREHIDRIGRENITAIVLTHCHFDHTMGAAELRDYTGAPLMIHFSEGDWVDDPRHNGVQFFMDAANAVFPKPDRLLHDGDVIDAGDLSVRVIHTPGHSPGSCCLEAEGNLFTGDTLFYGGVGRTDLPGGNSMHLMRSLGKLADIAGDMRVYPGHGQPSSLDFERKNNPYMG